MRIAFDIQLLERKAKTGIGWCADYVLKYIAKKKIPHEISVNYFIKSRGMENPEGLREFEKLGYRLNECEKFNGTLYKILWNFIPIPYYWFFGRSSDVTVFFNYYVPPFVKGKVITMIHDMVCFDCPETMNLKTKIMLKLSLKKSVKRADRIVTVSQFSKKQIIKYLNVDEDKIDVMPNGVDFDIFRRDLSQDDVERAKDKYGIKGDYLLYLGTLEPRKNITGIIEGYSRVYKKNKDIPRLILAGGKGWLYESIFERVRELKIQDMVTFTGYIDGEDVPLLMKGAMVFVFPSIYEGFGMPPIEAMACGTPVITSNNTSLPEVMGECGILVNPNDYDEIAQAMEKMINDDKLRKKMSEDGFERARLFSWENSADILLKSIERLQETE